MSQQLENQIVWSVEAFFFKKTIWKQFLNSLSLFFSCSDVFSSKFPKLSASDSYCNPSESLLLENQFETSNWGPFVKNLFHK